jgi:hypothetical protein
MLQNFVVRNFRCFSGLVLQPLARVNLIAGKNNVGKTALLEALQIHSYPQDCSLPFTIHGQRGMPDQPTFDWELATWLFYERDAGHGLTLVSQDDGGVTRTLQIWIVDGATARERFPEAERLLQGSFVEQLRAGNQPRIILKSEVGGQERYAIGVSGHGSMASFGSEVPWAGPSVLIGSGGGLGERDLKAFSELEAAKRPDELLPSLRLLEPRLQRLALLLLSGRPMIHGDVGLRQLVPVSLMGEGMRHLLSIVLAIITSSGGRVLVDEIENGLHYSVMKDVWKAIAHAARQANVQVFATTHSWECIQAAHHAYQESGPYELRYYRLDRIRDQIVVKSMDERMLSAIEKTDLEVR